MTRQKANRFALVGAAGVALALLIAGCGSGKSTASSPASSLGASSASSSASSVDTGESEQTDSGAGTSGPAMTLKAYAQDPKDSPDTQGVYKFAELVEKYTNGSIKVTVFPSGQLGSAQSALQQLRGGSIDFVDTGISYFTSVVPDLSVVQLPYLFPDAQSAYKALDGPLLDAFSKDLDAKGVKLLGFPEIGFRSITNDVRPINSAADVKGLKIRTLPDPLQTQYWKDLGSVPTPIDFNELYTALSTGTVDAEENPPTIINTGKFYEVQKYFSLTKHVYTPAILTMSSNRWNQMSSGQQNAVSKAAKDAIKWERNLSQSSQSDAIQNMKKNGMQVNLKPNIQSFKEHSDEIYSAWRKEHGNAVLSLITGDK